MEYLARFEELDGHLFRFDTRVYLEDYRPETHSECIAAIIGKNPGSAKPSKIGSLGPLALDGDKFLPFVRNRFRNAYLSQGRNPPNNAFIRVWNLFYLCNANLNQAKDAYRSMPDRVVCDSEKDSVPLCWFAWGPSDSQLDSYKDRFLAMRHIRPFFYDNSEKKVRESVPAITDSVRHTQGMPAEPVKIYLSRVL